MARVTVAIVAAVSTTRTAGMTVAVRRCVTIRAAISVTTAATTRPVAIGPAIPSTSAMTIAIAVAAVSISIAMGYLPAQNPVVSYPPVIIVTTEASGRPIAVVFGPVTRFITTLMTAVIAVAARSIPTATARVVRKRVVSTLLVKRAMTRTKTSSAVPSGFAIPTCTTAVVIATAGAGRRTRTATGKGVARSDAMNRVATSVMIVSEEPHHVRFGCAVL